jgi:hypothetical protein
MKWQPQTVLMCTSYKKSWNTEKALKRFTNKYPTQSQGEKMKYTPQERIDQTRQIFELWHETPRISNKDMWEILGVMYRTLRERVTNAVDLGYIVGPQIRKKSFKNFPEHVCLADCMYPGEMYKKYAENKGVIYHAIMDGFATFLIISRKELNIKGSLFSGLRTDYLMSFPPYRDWDESVVYMRNMIEQFNPDAYTPKNYITNHWNKTVEWPDEYETLYQEFKYNLRLPFDPIARDKHNIYGRVAYEWLERLSEYCTVFTSYFPQTIKGYEPYVYLFETDYEDFIIDLFSQLPSTVWFFKVADKLLLYTWMDRGSMKNVEYRTREISKLHTLLVIEDLLKREIVTNEQHAFVQCYWRERL